MILFKKVLWPVAHARISDARQTGSSAGGVAAAATSRTGRGAALGTPIVGATIGSLTLLEFSEGHAYSSFEDTVALGNVRPGEEVPDPGVPPTRPLERGRTGASRGRHRDTGRAFGRSRDPLRDLTAGGGPEDHVSRAAPPGQHDLERTTADVDDPWVARRRGTIVATIPSLTRGRTAIAALIRITERTGRRHEGGQEEQVPHPPFSFRSCS